MTTRRTAPQPQHASGWALLYFALLTVVLLFPVVLNADRWAKDPGDPVLNAYILSWDVHALLTHPAGLFNAPFFHPYPLTLAYSESLLGDLPVALPVIALTGNGLLAANLLLLLGYALAGWCTYLLVARWTGNFWAGLVAGTLFAFNPWHLQHLAHLQLVTVPGLPLVLLLADRLLRNGRWPDLGWLVLVFNLQFLCSYYVGLFLALLVALLALAYLLVRLARPTRGLAGQVAVFVVVTAALQLPLAWPYFTVAHSLGLQRPLGEIVSYSAHLGSYLAPSPDHPLYGALLAGFRALGPENAETALFLGFLGLVLAIVAVLRPPEDLLSRRRVLVLASLTVVMALLSFGPQTRGAHPWPLPYALLYHLVPGFKGLRAVARLAVMVALGLAVLAGYGMAALARRWPRRQAVVGVLLCVLAVAEGGDFRPRRRHSAGGDRRARALPLVRAAGTAYGAGLPADPPVALGPRLYGVYAPVLRCGQLAAPAQRLQRVHPAAL